jgi:hypothetical protein
MDFDDTHREAIMHVGAPVFPALLAAGEDTTGVEFLRATVAGYEVAGQLGTAHGDRVHLRGFQCVKRGVELLLGPAVQRLQSIAIKALALGGRNADQKVKKFRGMRVHRARLSLQRRYQNRGQLLQCTKLIGGKEMRGCFSDQVGLRNGKLRDFLRLLRRLTSGRVGLRGWPLRLCGGRLCLACGQGSGRGRGQQTLDESPAFHK